MVLITVDNDVHAALTQKKADYAKQGKRLSHGKIILLALEGSL